MLLYCFSLSFALGLVSNLGADAGLISGVRSWLETRRACLTDCPTYFDHVCGFDPDLGYMLADNKCLMVRHNLCYKTHYEESHELLCTKLLNTTEGLSHLVVVSKMKHRISQSNAKIVVLKVG